MQHTIFFYEGVDGYRYLSLNDLTLQSPPINLKNEEDLISEFCEARPNTFTVFFQKQEEKFILIYGIFFSDLEDTKGRKGIHFRHSINFARAGELYPSILNLLKLLNVEEKKQLFLILREIARHGSAKINELGNFLRSIFQPKYKVDSPDVFSSTTSLRNVKKIVHDIGGLSAYVWLALAIEKTNDTGNWTMFEKFEKNKVVTYVSEKGIDITVADFFQINRLVEIPQIGVQNSTEQIEARETIQKAIRDLEIILSKLDRTDKKKLSVDSITRLITGNHLTSIWKRIFSFLIVIGFILFVLYFSLLIFLRFPIYRFF
jgi:hypothetical protein